MSVARGLNVMVGLCTAVLVVAALYQARTIFAPVAFALFAIAIVWPLQRALQGVLPKLAALTATVLATLVVITVLGSLVGWGFGRAGRALIADAPRFQAIYAEWAEWLEEHGILIGALLADNFNVNWLVRVLQQIASRLNSTLSFAVLALVFIILGILEVDDTRRKLASFRNADVGEKLSRAAADTATRLQKYMWVRTWMSILTGALVWAFSSLMGLQLAAEWGVIAFVLNYIPFIGPLIATVFPTLFALAQFGSWQLTLVVFICLNLIQFVIGSYLEPRVTGNALSISPFMVLFAVFFFSFLWGIPGAFIGVPILIAALTVCEQHPASQWVVDLCASPKTR